MSKVLDSPLHKYLAIGGALGLVYAVVHYLANRKHSTKTTISLQETRVIIKEIKYQVYANCIPFAEGVDKKLKASYPAKDLEVFLRTELTKIYQSKEDLILQKRGVSQDELKLALQNYRKDAQIKKDQAQIFKVLEESIAGKIDLTVIPQAYKLYSDKELLGIYRTMCEEIGIKVWEKLMECRRDHPGFNPKDDKHFRQAMRELGIYQFKVKFLNAKGFKEEWGCSNFIFLKLFEGVKRDNPEIKAGAGLVEKGYQNIISQISTDPDNYDRTHILRIMQDATTAKPKNPPPVNKPEVEKPKHVVSAPQPPAPPLVVRKTAPVQQKPKEEDEFDMERLMMEELLSRSQEEPKQVKVERNVAVSQPVEIKKEEVAPIVVAQVQVEQKVERIEVIEVQEEPKRVDQLRQSQQNTVASNLQQQVVNESNNIQQVRAAEISEPIEHVGPEQQQRHQEKIQQAPIQIAKREIVQPQIQRQQIIVQQQPIEQVPKQQQQHHEVKQQNAPQQVIQPQSVPASQPEKDIEEYRKEQQQGNQAAEQIRQN